MEMVILMSFGFSVEDLLTLSRSFYIQSPLALISIILVAWKLDSPADSQVDGKKESTFRKLRRIDFLGSISLALAIVGFLICLALGGQKIPWNHPLIWIILPSSAVLGLSFLLVEAYWAKEPIFPLTLLVHRDVATAYLISALQIAAQFAVSL
jgi:hypothetical protein